MPVKPESTEIWTSKPLKRLLDREAQELVNDPATFRAEIQRVLKKGIERSPDSEREAAGEAIIMAHSGVVARLGKMEICGIRNQETADELPELALEIVARESHGLRVSRVTSFLSQNDCDLIAAGISGLRHDVMLPYYSPVHRTVTATLMRDLGIVTRVPQELEEERTRDLPTETRRLMDRVLDTPDNEDYKKTPLHRLIESKGLDIESMKNVRIDGDGKLWIIESDIATNGVKNLVNAVGKTSKAQDGFQLVADALATRGWPYEIEDDLKGVPLEAAAIVRSKVNHLLFLRTQRFEEDSRKARKRLDSKKKE